MLNRAPLAQALPLPQHQSVTWEDGSPVRALGWSRRGLPIWPVHGGAEDDEDQAAKDAAAAAAKAGKTFTQAELDAINTRTRDKAERDTRKKILEGLGLPEDTRPEDVKKTLDEAREKDLAALSAADRAKREADDAKAAAERATAAAAATQRELDQEKHDLRVAGLLDREGVGAGLDDDESGEKRDKAIARATRLLDVEVGADSDVIRKAIKDLKADVPGLFGETGTGGGAGAVDGRPGGRAPGTQRTAGKSGVAAGREEAIRRGWIKDTAKSA